MLLKDRVTLFRNEFLKKITYAPYLCLITLTLILSFSLWGVSRIQTDFHYEIWFQKDDPELLKFKKFQRTFGNDEILIFSVYKKEGILNRPSVAIIKELTEDLWSLKGTLDVDSIANYNHAFALEDDEISIEPFYAADKFSKENWQERLKIIDEIPIFHNYYINTEATIALIYAKQRPYIDSRPDEQAIVEQAREFIRKFEKKYPTYDFKVAGGLTVGNSYREIASHDLITILPLMFLIIGAILLFFFRSSMGLFIPFIITSFSCLSTFAIAGFCDIKFNNILGLIPQALMAISIADSVHILVSYYQQKATSENAKESIYMAMKKNFYPTLLTTLSTSMGFISFSTAFMKPLIHFGVLSAIGTLIAWFTTFLVFIVWVHFLDKDGPITNKTHFILINPHSLLGISARKRKVFLIGFFLATLGATFLGLQNEINTNPINYFRSDVPAKIANDFILDKLGAMPGPEIIIRAKGPREAFNPEFLHRVDAFINDLLNKKEIIQINSIIPVIKQLNRTLHANESLYYTLPNQQNSIAQLVLLYQMGLSQGKSINDRISLDSSKLKLSLLWTLQNSKESIALLEEVKKIAMIKNLDITITGKNPLFLGLNERVSKSLLYSLTLAIFLISILMALVFKSIKLFLISLICNLSPLMLGAAIMTIFEIPISISSAMVFSVCLGIVVDDTIHFLMRYKELSIESIQDSKDNQELIARVLRESGSSIFVTSVILVVGFGLFIFAQFMLNVHFGLIAAVILASAAFIDLFILPLFLKKVAS